MKKFHRYILLINIFFGCVLCMYFAPKSEGKKSATEFINTLKKPIIIKDISKQFQGQRCFTTKVHYMLIDIMANLLTFSFVSLTGVITSIISGE